MVHEYLEDPVVLTNALAAAHQFVPVLLDVAKRFQIEIGSHPYSLRHANARSRLICGYDRTLQQIDTVSLKNPEAEIGLFERCNPHQSDDST